MEPHRVRQTADVREALRYLATFGGKIFVVKLPSVACRSEYFESLLRDICLLRSAGVHLILVHGAGSELEDCKVSWEECNGRLLLPYPLPESFLEDVHHLTFRIQQELTVRESALQILTVTGTFIRARFWEDDEETTPAPSPKSAAVVELVLSDLKETALQPRRVPILSPICVDQDGASLFVPSDELAACVAVAVGASKLVTLTDVDGLVLDRQLVEDITAEQANRHLRDGDVYGRMERKVSCCVTACAGGVPRTHIVNWKTDGSLLEEVLTGHGVGTMIHSDPVPYHHTRPANVGDVPAIIGLLKQPVFAGTGRRWTRRDVQQHLGHFRVYERDGVVYACLSVEPHGTGTAEEIRNFAIHPEYISAAIVQKVLTDAVDHARSRGVPRLVAETPLCDWFQAAQFRQVSPDESRELYGDESRVAFLRELRVS